MSHLNSIKKISIAAACTALMFSCASNVKKDSYTTDNWLASGSISITRPLPAQASLNSVSAIGLGFSANTTPVSTAFSKTSAIIDIEEGKVYVTGSARLGTSEFSIEKQANRIDTGSYKILMKQENAPWHASDAYYTDRKLPVPPSGHKDRFLKAALGSKTIFVDGYTPIHNSSESAEMVGGIVLSSDVLEELYSSLEVGSTIEIK